jgi:hypothetical protein
MTRNPDPADLPLDPLREMGKQVHARYALAVRIAKAHWPADTPAEALASAVHTIFIELSMAAKAGATMPGSHGAAPRPAEAPPTCPVCESAMRDQRATKRGNQPDWKCTQSACDGAVWLDRKRRNGAHP